MLNKHLKQEYCDKLSPTLVSMEIFSNIHAHNRSQDGKLQKLKKFLLNIAYPILERLHSILTNSANPDQTLMNNIRKIAYDAVVALSQSNQEQV